MKTTLGSLVLVATVLASSGSCHLFRRRPPPQGCALGDRTVSGIAPVVVIGFSLSRNGEALRRSLTAVGNDDKPRAEVLLAQEREARLGM